MFLSNLSIKQPVFATMMMVALAVLGIVSYQQLNVDLFPDVDFPVVTVTTIYPGASPETVEREVTKKIEEAINTVEGVRHVESTPRRASRTSSSSSSSRSRRQTASQDVRGKIAAIRGDAAARDRGADRPAHRLRPRCRSSRSASTRPGLSPSGRDHVSPRRSSSGGSRTCAAWAPCNLVGESTREIQVVVDRPEARGLPHLARARWWRRCGARTSTCRPARPTAGATEALVRVAARGRTAADIAQIPVKRAGGTAIRVSDVAQVIDGIEQPKNLAFLDERPALALDIQKQSGANTVAVADGVRKADRRSMQKELPPGVSLSDHHGRLDVHPRVDRRRQRHDDHRRPADRASSSTCS